MPTSEPAVSLVSARIELLELTLLAVRRETPKGEEYSSGMSGKEALITA